MSRPIIRTCPGDLDVDRHQSLNLRGHQPVREDQSSPADWMVTLERLVTLSQTCRGTDPRTYAYRYFVPGRP